MGSLSSVTKLGNLTERRRHASIKARVMRKWKNELTERKGSYYIDLILIDEEVVILLIIHQSQSTTIQATINKSIQKRFDEGVEEGNTYHISKFRKVENNHTGKLTNHKFKIWFEFSTSLITISTIVNTAQLFHFASFSDIIEDNIIQGLCVDVIGELVSYHPISEYPNGIRRTQIDLQDKDQVELSVTLWGPYIDDFIKIVNDHKDGERPVLAVQFVNRAEWRENVKLNSIRGATKIYVNPDIPEVARFMKRRDEDKGSDASRLSAASNNIDDILSKAKLLSLEEIKKTDKAREYVTLATILQIDSNSGWFYNSCNKCKKKCNKNDDNLYYCSSTVSCPNASTGSKLLTPRFQVKFFVTGGKDIFSEMIMFDQQIGQLIDIPASKLVEKMENDDDIDSIPHKLSKFIDKELVIKLRVSRQYNLESRSYCYTVSKFSEDKVTIAKWNELYEKNKAKGKEKAETHISDEVFDGNGNSTIEKSESSDLNSGEIIDCMAPPTTPSSYKTPTKRDVVVIDDIIDITPVQDKESIVKTPIHKYKSKKIKQEK